MSIPEFEKLKQNFIQSPERRKMWEEKGLPGSAFESLPAEIVNKIFINLDLSSATALNKTAKFLKDALSDPQAMRIFAINTGVSSEEMSKFIDLYSKISLKSFYLIGMDGGTISSITTLDPVRVEQRLEKEIREFKNDASKKFLREKLENLPTTKIRDKNEYFETIIVEAMDKVPLGKYVFWRLPDGKIKACCKTKEGVQIKVIDNIANFEKKSGLKKIPLTRQDRYSMRFDKRQPMS